MSEIADFRQFPLGAVAAYETLMQRFAYLRPLSQVQTVLSHGLTALLLAVSLVGFYQLGSLAIEAHDASRPAVVAASTNTPKKPTPTAAPAVKSLPRSAPTALQIPSINVDTSVVGVGQNSDGSIQVPGPEEAGWYTLGPSPGEIGPAVIVGHVDYVTIGPAVFWNLRNMKPGDIITVNRQDGTTVNFTVTSVESYDKGVFPTGKIYGNINYPGLRLITCDGDFNYVTHHYSNNLVVYARADL